MNLGNDREPVHRLNSLQWFLFHSPKWKQQKPKQLKKSVKPIK